MTDEDRLAEIAPGVTVERASGAAWLKTQPHQAWAFYARRIARVRAAAALPPLLAIARWAGAMGHGAFAVTTNVDGQLHRARFDAWRVVERHGALEWLQCARDCGAPLSPGGMIDVVVESGRAVDPLPRCTCGALLRPNVALVGDARWDASRAREQESRLDDWLGELRLARGRRVVVVECGAAGELRACAQRLSGALDATLVRLGAGTDIDGDIAESIAAIDRRFAPLPSSPPRIVSRPRLAIPTRVL
jgi:hypothetical protein